MRRRSTSVPFGSPPTAPKSPPMICSAKFMAADYLKQAAVCSGNVGQRQDSYQFQSAMNILVSSGALPLRLEANTSFSPS